MAEARRFEFVEGTSKKFWEVSVEGNAVTTHYGRIGAAGHTTAKDADSPDAAQRLYERLVREKTRKGYVEVGGAAPIRTAPNKPAHPLLERGMKLLLQMADYDAEDPVLFAVQDASEGLELQMTTCDGKSKLTFTREALENARKFLAVSQGSAFTDEGEVGDAPVAKNSPPFLLGRAAFLELKRGQTVLHGDGGEETVKLAGTRKIRALIGGKKMELEVLVAEGTESISELLVLDDATWPVVLRMVWGNDCFTELRAAGVKVRYPDDEDDEPEAFSTFRDISAASAAPAEATSELVQLVVDCARASAAGEPIKAVVSKHKQLAMHPAAALLKRIEPECDDELAVLRAGTLAPKSTALPEAAVEAAKKLGVPMFVPIAVEDPETVAPHETGHAVLIAGGRICVLGTRGKTLLASFWDPQTGLPTRVIKLGSALNGVHRDVCGARLLDDGALWVATPNKVFLLPAGADKAKSHPWDKAMHSGRTGVRTDVAFHPSGKFAVTCTRLAGADELVRVELPTCRFRLLQTLERFDYDPRYAFTADGRLVVAQPSGVKVYDESGRELRKIPFKPKKEFLNFALEISADGERVACVDSDLGETRVFSLDTGEKIAEFPYEVRFAAEPDRYLRHDFEASRLEQLDSAGKVRAVLGVFTSSGEDSELGPFAMTSDGLLIENADETGVRFHRSPACSK